MDTHETNARLEKAYRGWKESFNPEGIAATFSPPILLSATEEYCAAQLKVLVYGQETGGWQWTSELRTQYPNYPTDWPYLDLETLADFLKNDDAVEALCWGYREFAFAKYQPKNRRSPFWNTFRSIQSWPGVGVMYSNISKVDFKNGAFIGCQDRASADRMIEEQRGIVAAEITILKPDVCIFFTGPNYDRIMQAVFPSVAFERAIMIEAPIREFARACHPSLPDHTYRTYHPAYLCRSRKRFYLDNIRQIVAQSDD